MTGLIRKYFVLKPRGDNPYAAASRAAMIAYAQAIQDHNEELGTELKIWVADEITRVRLPVDGETD